MQEEHGLREDAKRTLIDLLFEVKTPAAEKPSALFLLGAIAIEEGEIALGKRRWHAVQKDYPNSPEAKLVQQQAEAFSLLPEMASQASILQPLANNYLRYASNWSRGRATTWVLELEDLPKVEAAIQWYDLIIRDFPGSDAARIALESKMQTILGWQEETGAARRYGLAYDFPKYMPMLLITFQEYVDTFPEAPARHGFRFLIGQAYYATLDFGHAKEWFQGVLESDPSGKSIFGLLARLRLQQMN